MANKYIKRAQITPEMEMELSHSPLGVLTRAKTLALHSHSDYLQLRSRRLLKHAAFPHKSSSATMKRHPHSITRQKWNLHSTSSITNLEFDRSTRESTPCSSVIREEDTIKTTPCSTTKRTNGTRRTQRVQSCVLGNIPSAEEIDEFFAYAEQQQQQKQRLFVEKYNFDIVNDMPVPGRYEWVRVSQ